MRDIVNDINTRDILQAQEVNSLTFLLTKDGDDNVSTDHFAVVGRIYLKNSALQYPLKTVSRLCFLLELSFTNSRCSRVDKLN